MAIKQTVKNLVLGLSVMVASLVFLAPVTVSAIGANGCEVETAIIKCTGVSGTGDVEHTGAWSLLLTALNILTAGVAIAAVAGLVYGAILYTTSAGSPEGTKKAMEVIRNVVIGIVAYALMYSGVNFLIPGGLFT